VLRVRKAVFSIVSPWFVLPLKQKPDNMRFVAFLRSTDHRATRIRLGAALCVIVLACCCNAEKKVLNSEKKTQNVVNAWLKAHPLKIDTNFVFLPGDTTTTLLIGYDTATVRDTVTKYITQTITKTKTVTNTVHDTVKVTIGCSGVKEPCALLKAAQDGLASKMAQYDQQVLEAQRQKLKADKWKFRFWLAVSVFSLLAGLFIGFKFFKPRMIGL
jgi:hypothetical protein